MVPVICRFILYFLTIVFDLAGVQYELGKRFTYIPLISHEMSRLFHTIIWYPWLFALNGDQPYLMGQPQLSKIAIYEIPLYFADLPYKKLYGGILNWGYPQIIHFRRNSHY